MFNPGLFVCITDHILERKPINVVNVVKFLVSRFNFKGRKEHILARNHMNVISVVKPLPRTVLFNT